MLSPSDLRSLIEKATSEYVGSSLLSLIPSDKRTEVLDRSVETALTAFEHTSSTSMYSGSRQWSAGEILEKAVSGTSLRSAEVGSRGALYHPSSLYLGVGSGGNEHTEYREYPNRLTLDTLRAMSGNTTIIAAIHNTRVNQVAIAARPQEDRYSAGFCIKPRNRDAKVGKKERERAREIEKFICYTGVTKRPSRRDNFETWVRKFVRDSLTFDQAVTQIIPQRRMKNSEDFVPAEFMAMDASTFRIAQYKDLSGDVLDSGFVQIIDGEIIEHFSRDEIIWGIRNPRTDVRTSGYGFSELEQMINVITSILFSEEYNRRIFQTGSTPKGMIFIKTTPQSMYGGNQAFQEQLEAFRRQWWAQVQGVQNAWKVPIVAGPEMQWIDLERGNRDMEWSNYHEMLIKIACAIYQIDPAEINFDIRAMQSAPAALNVSSAEFQVKYSKDKGLIPLLRWLEDCINQHLIWPIDDNFVFRFVGIDANTERDAVQLKQQEVQSFKTLNEVRKEMDLPELKGGDVVLNSLYTMHLQDVEAKEQQDQQQGQEAAPWDLFDGQQQQGGEEQEQEEQPQGEEEMGAAAQAGAPMRRSLRSVKLKKSKQIRRRVA